jgi:beta-galactosidase
MGDRHVGLFRNLRTPLLLGLALAGLPACSATSLKGGNASAANAPASDRQRTSLDAGWAFHLGDVSPNNDVITAAYDDRQWQRIDVPHDYVLEGTYANSKEKTQRGHAYLPANVAWYRKHFTIPASDQGKVLRLDFDGVFRDSQVWLNGQPLGRHQSGYTPFTYDITQSAKVGADNVLVVRVDPRDFEGWWYEGGGIYRHVSLTALAPLHVAHWGTYVVSTVPNGDQGASDRADLTIQTAVENVAATAAGCRIVSEIVAPDGAVLKTMEAPATAPAAGRHEVTQYATSTTPSSGPSNPPISTSSARRSSRAAAPSTTPR